MGFNPDYAAMAFGVHEAYEPDPVRWNPFNKVVQDHRDGTIDHEATNRERARRGLPVPWTPEIGGVEVHEPAVW
jgi:hypothetical protein